MQAQVAPVDADLAAQLIAEAQAIIDVLNGGGTTEAETIEITSIGQNDHGKPHLRIRGKAVKKKLATTYKA